VVDAVCFLHDANLSRAPSPGNNVVVIGGGNVAIDAVRVAKRLGAEKVTLLYRRTEAEMPAEDEEIQGAREEGIEFHFLTSPTEVLQENGRVTGIRCIVNELGEPDASGRRRPVPVAGSEFVLPCDAVIPAIGQRVDLSWQDPVCRLECTPRSLIVADPRTLQTSQPHVFAAGDAVSGPATVVEAIGATHRAVDNMIRDLEGHLEADQERFVPETAAKGVAGPSPADECTWSGIPTDCAPQPREQITHLDWAVRAAGFEEESIGLTEAQAQREADRCLNCGVCSECMECVRVCEANAIDHTQQPEEIEVKVGSIILATGYDLLDPTPMQPYGYGRLPNVFTSLEFERLSNATGPTGGKILMRDAEGNFARPPQSVALVHCVGSRDVNYHEYCSRVCCMYALKYSHLIKEKVGHDTQVYDFYIDMRCFGEGYEEFYRRCQEEGTTFIRGKVAEISDQAQSPEEEGKLVAIAEDTLLGKRLRVPVDMVVLCSAIQARRDAVDVGRIFGVNIGSDGFFLEEHPKLGPLNTATDGVFLAGVCQSPKDIPDTVAQASGAAAKALSLATRGQVAVPSAISWIDPDICAGCQTCIGLCPYGAIEFDERRGVSVVNAAVCKGCGSCSGFCPSGAAQVAHFNKKQIFAEFDGLMDALEAVGQ
jgi:heterodisulfide reductase subunit A